MWLHHFSTPKHCTTRDLTNHFHLSHFRGVVVVSPSNAIYISLWTNGGEIFP